MLVGHYCRCKRHRQPPVAVLGMSHLGFFPFLHSWDRISSLNHSDNTLVKEEEPMMDSNPEPEVLPQLQYNYCLYDWRIHDLEFHLGA